jgi:hypothetical protein
MADVDAELLLAGKELDKVSRITEDIVSISDSYPGRRD